MVAKISVGSSLYGAIAYNGEKINEAQGRLLTTNRIYNDGSGTVDIGKAMEGFLTFLPPQMKIEKPVVHISLNPHPEDVLTDIELQNIAREYLEKLGFGNQPYLVFKHEDIDRHHLHIVTVNVDENGKRLNRDFLYRRSDRIRRELEQKYGLHPAERKNQRLDNPLRKVAASAGDVKKQVGNTVKALNGQYRFQTMGEYRALLSLYNMTVEEALTFFENVPSIRRKIETLYDVGLSYIRLGQPSTTLSGGEAQRIKLATELSKRSTGKTIYILDEPTTGLHFADVHKLIEILKRLSEGGNTVVVIEHNLDVIKTADYIIDIGPEGGDKGGTVIAKGTPEEVAANPASYTGQYVKKYLTK